MKVKEAFAGGEKMSRKRKLAQTAENTRADREEFLSETLNLSVSPQGENRYLLTWNETVGDGYEVQRMAEDGVWETVERLEKTAAR